MKPQTKFFGLSLVVSALAFLMPDPARARELACESGPCDFYIQGVPFDGKCGDGKKGACACHWQGNEQEQSACIKDYN